MGIYELMKENWQAYCLMCAVTYIEEVSKPTLHPQIKNGIKFICFHSNRLKMKNPEVVGKLFNITRAWQVKKKQELIGETFTKPRIEPYSGQFQFYFSPKWLSLIISKCGRIPNKYSLETAVRRIKALKLYKKDKIKLNKNLFNIFLKNKKLAAGAFVVSLDLECRGVQSGRPTLCMSEKFKDFLEFMLKIAQKWGWATKNGMSPVKVEYSKRLGINASPQYEFRINSEGLKEIYKLAGPLADRSKDECIKFNIQRSNKYQNNGYNNRSKNTKFKILRYIKKHKNSTTTQLQFIANVGVDVVQEHLYTLERLGKVKKERKGKRYIWNIKNDN